MRVALYGVVVLSAWVLTTGATWAAESEGAPVITVTGDGGGSSLDARVTKLERILNGQGLADLLTRIQRLQEDVQKLRGDLEVQGNDINGIKQRQRDLYLDLDRRLQKLETAAASMTNPSASTAAPSLPAQSGSVSPAAGSAPVAAGVTPAMPSTTQPTAPGTTSPMSTPPAANPGQEQVDYQKAFDLLKGGHYDDAIAGFKEVLKNYPNGNLADNAQYWIGEAHFAARRFSEAADEFGKVIHDYPQSPKVPDAMLKLGFSYYELAAWGKARDTLEQLKGRYPQSTAAQLADRRLQKMKSEGH